MKTSTYIGLVISWFVASISFGMWQHSIWAGIFMAGVLVMLDPRSY